MKYAIAAIAAAALVLGISTCGRSHCADLQELMLQQVALIRACGNHVIQARNSADVVCAIDRFCVSMENLSPRAQLLLGKYPELANDLSRRRIPDVLQETMKQVNELKPVLFKASAKLMQFSGNPAVEAARKKWETTMGRVSWNRMASN